MVPIKTLVLGITLAALCHPALASTTQADMDKKQQLEFLSFLAFIGSVAEMESAGIDIDQLLNDPSQKKQAETDE